jgi:hypothetical protein
LSGAGEAGGLFEAALVAGEVGDGGGGGADGLLAGLFEAFEIALSFGGAAVVAGPAGETAEGFGLIGVGEQDLFPGLGGEIDPAAVFEGARLAQEDLGGGGGLGLGRKGHEGRGEQSHPEGEGQMLQHTWVSFTRSVPSGAKR